MEIPVLLVRVVVIVLAIFTSYVLYNHVVRPWILEPLCLVNSNACARLAYYSYNNSALVHVRNTDTWLWYNGDKAFVYGQPVGQICKDPKKYSPAYSINTKTGLQEGYKCVLSLEEVIKFYTDKGVKMEYLVTNATKNFDVYSALNFLDDKGVIDLKSSGN